MRVRVDEKSNYKAVFFDNGKTIRMNIDPLKSISTPQHPEIEDIAINSKCLANCFVSGTKVLTSSGYVNIEDITLGEEVTSYNEVTCVFEQKNVYDIFKNKYSGEIIEIELENGNIINCTPNHKLLTNKGWIESSNLDITNLIMNCNDIYYTKIISININIVDDIFVYNFSVEDNHNYIVEDVVVSNCHYCYTSALKSGSNFGNIIDKAKEVWGSLEMNQRPFQIAIGGAGESTLHPQWIDFVKTVRELGILPNYTTNGMHLTDDILDATEKYCGGVAVSWHPHIEKFFHSSIEKYSKINTKLNTHIIVGDDKSVSDLKRLYEMYHDKIDYFVLLPYQAVGRAKTIDVHKNWIEVFKFIKTVDTSKFAFGALFYEWLKNNDVGIKIDVYEPEIYSGYRMMDDSYKMLRKSSYNLELK